MVTLHPSPSHLHHPAPHTFGSPSPLRCFCCHPQASTSFPSGHLDYLHDVCYDWYGDRLATCSADHRIRIFQRIPPTPVAAASTFSPSSSSPSSLPPYVCVAELRGHSGSIHRLSFCHPEFGTLLASCSSDRNVLIHEEQRDAASLTPPHSTSTSTSTSTPTLTPTPRPGYAWKTVAHLRDSKVSVVDCEFAPPHLGLLLATLGIDGRLRIYENRDLMSPFAWGPRDEIHCADPAAAAAGPITCSALAWNPSPFDPAMLAVACNHSVRVYECERGSNGKWRSLVTWSDSDDLIHDVAWAPNVGRSYHLIASAGKDGVVRVYTLRWEDRTAAGGAGGVAGGSWQHALVGVLRGHEQQVWRVSWNVSGSMLASTGDDGCTRVWKSDYNLQWKQIAQTQTPTQQPAQ